MSTVVTKNVQVGTSGTPANNFTLYQPATPDGTVRLANGNSGSTTDVLTATSAGNVGIGTSSPVSKLEVKGAAGVTSFTGATRLGVTTSGSTAVNDYSGIDFASTQSSNPTARVAVISTSSGSYLRFGTSNSYATGITNTAMSIHYNGYVSMPYQPAFYADAYAYSAGQSRTSGVVFNSSTTANLITVTNNGSHFNASTGRFTAPVSGLYFFSGQYSRSAGNATTGIRVNGATTYSQNLSYGADWQTGSSSAVFSLNAGDYVEFMYGATNATTTYSYTVNFGGHLIG